MGEYLPQGHGSGMGAINGLTTSQSLNIVHKHTEERSDGSKISHEKTMEFSSSDIIKGSEWLIPRNNKFKHDRQEDTSRKTERLLTVRDTSIFDDGRGNRIIDENAIQTKDFEESKGFALIGNKPEIKNDERGRLIHDFPREQNPLKLIGSGGFIPLIGDL